MNPATIAKAIVGALVAGLGSLGTALDDGHVSAQEWTFVAVAFLVALGVVWAVPNKPDSEFLNVLNGEAATAKRRKRPAEPGEDGQASTDLLLVAVLVGVVLLLFGVRFG